MTWRIARTLLTLRAEVDLLRPDRDTGSDGAIGNEEHASRDSDHNPWVIDSAGVGVVTAIDITDDQGTLTKFLWDRLLESRDDRIKYVIGEGEFFSSYATSTRQAWQVVPYTGPNGHFSHLHISVQPDPPSYDSERTWGIFTTEDDMTPEQVEKLNATHLLATAAADDAAATRKIVEDLLEPLLRKKDNVPYARLQHIVEKSAKAALGKPAEDS